MKRYQQIRQEIVDTSQWLWRHGYFGSRLSAGGNVSVRIPESPLLAITPSGRPYMQMEADDICLVDRDGTQVAGKYAPSIETGMHARIYQTRVDVHAVVHTHQPHASVFALINQPIPALFDEVALAIGERVDVVPYALSGSAELAANVADTVGNDCFCYIMQNHGALNLGTTLEAARRHAELLEKCAQAYQLALATGHPVTTLPPETLAWIHRQRS